jgi:phage regulator Rha-like protein
MNDLMASDRTMDSREIAEITKKQHGHVCRDIQEMLDRLKGFNRSSFGSTYLAANGEERRCYKLPYRETMILVSGYSVELRSRVVDRWLELERSAAPALPKTLPEALRLAADIEEQRQALEDKVAELAPKAAYADEIDATGAGIPLGDFAAVLASGGWDIGRNRLFRLLVEKRIIFKEWNAALNEMVYLPHIDRIPKHMVVHEVPVREKSAIRPKVLITPAGQRWLIDRFHAWNIKRAARIESDDLLLDFSPGALA